MSPPSAEMVLGAQGQSQSRKPGLSVAALWARAGGREGGVAEAEIATILPPSPSPPSPRCLWLSGLSRYRLAHLLSCELGVSVVCRSSFCTQ